MIPLVAIIGSSSPIGQELTREFVSKEIEVVGISHRKSDLHSVFADISNPDSVAFALSRISPDVVIHLAHKSMASYSNNQSKYVEENLRFTSNLLKGAVQGGAKKIIFSSSSAVYGDQNLSPSKELSDVFPTTPYSELKLICEDEIDKISKEFGIESTSLRIFNVYGPGFSNSLINKLLDYKNQDEIILKGPQNFIRDYIHVSDVVSSIVNVALSTQQLPRVLNVGTGLGTSNQDLIELISGTKHRSFSIVPDRNSYSVADTTLFTEFFPPAKRFLTDQLLVDFEL